MTERSPSTPDTPFAELRMERLQLPDGRYLILYDWDPAGPKPDGAPPSGAQQPGHEAAAADDV